MGKLFLKMSLVVLILALRAHAAVDEDDDDEDDDSPSVQTCAACKGPSAQESDDEQDDDQADEQTPASPFSLNGSFLLGTPAQGTSPQANQTGYYLNLDPEWKASDNISLFAAIMTRQSLSFNEGLSFTQSDIGVKYENADHSAFFYPSYSLSAMLPFNSDEVQVDGYRGGLMPAIKLTHELADEESEFSFTLAEALLSHNEQIALDGTTNVQMYTLLTAAGECKISDFWSIGGELNYAEQHFYGGQNHGQLGFDFYASLAVFKDSDSTLLIGFGNYPVPRESVNLTTAPSVFNQNLNFAYVGVSFSL